MIERREWRWVAWVALVVVAVSWLPYLVAWAVAPPSAHFAGMIYNPLDGQSYLAKMRLGAGGTWLFHLLYTPDPPQGAAPIFLFHLLLGHLARWLGLSLLAVYHGARTAGGLALLFGLYRLAADLVDGVKQRRFLFLLTTLGSGLGWLSLLLGHQTPDLWVAEAFPFLSLLTNAHFPISLALMAWAAHWGLQAGRKPGSGAGLVMAMVALGAIQPFGLLPLLGGVGGAWVADSLRERRVYWRGVAWLVLAAFLAFPYPLYTFWVIHADPVLAAWSEQNVTPAPSLVSWLLGLGVPGALALWGSVVAMRRGRDSDGLLLGWLLATVVGLALPLSLARRLSLGLAMPVGLLAGLGLWRMAARHRLLGSLLVALTTLTPLLLLAMGVGAALNRYPMLYLSDGEWVALGWLQENVPRDTVVLCAPETGLFVPAWAGQRVVYGHPFETVNAEARRARVEAYWRGERDETWLDQLGVEYLLYGPREQALGPPPAGELLLVAGDTSVYHR